MTKVEKVEQLIHDLAHKAALGRLDEHFQVDDNRGSKASAALNLKRYESSYEYHTMSYRMRFGLITSKEFYAWEESRKR